MLLLLGVSVVATCPVKRLVFDFETVRTDMKPQPKVSGQAALPISCSVETAVTESALLDISKPGVQKITSLLLFVALLFYPGRLAKALQLPFYSNNVRKATPVPLFLRNSSWLL